MSGVHTDTYRRLALAWLCRSASWPKKFRDLVNPAAEIVWDSSKPDGTPRKVLGVSKLNCLGWKASIERDAGLSHTYDWFLKSQEGLGGAENAGRAA